MKTFSSFTTALTAFAALGSALDLAHERAGDVFSKIHFPSVGGVLHNGNSTGQFRNINGESLYITGRQSRSPGVGILYLTDIFGVQLVNNRLLADSIAKAGYFVVEPDLFRGDPVPADALTDPASTFNLTAWQARHPQAEIEAIIESAITTLRTTYGVSKVGATGYCFGGRYVARFLAAGRGIDAGFAAHPSGTQVSEWEAVSKPISIAFGALDASNTAENRTTIEAIFQSGNKTYQTALFSNAEHGFAVRTDLGVKQKAFAQESAYVQAVRWFDAWVKDL